MKFWSGVFHPQAPLLRKWNAIFLVLCAAALLLDPLFLYIPGIDNGRKCLWLDKPLEKIVTALRSLIDVIYIIHIAFQFCTGFQPSSSQEFGRRELVFDYHSIAKRYLLSTFFLVDILSILPLPQVAILIIIPNLRGSRNFNTENILKYVVLFQFVPRFIRMHQLYREIQRTSYAIAITTWTRALITLFLYIVAAHVVGAFWYLLAIERERFCWQAACQSKAGCDLRTLYCDENTEGYRFLNNHTFLSANCPTDSVGRSPFDFGIYFDALNSGAVESRNFSGKFFYCFWWALQNMSTLAQSLKTSTYVGEICFAACIFICGLVLLSLIIGLIQTAIVSSTVRLEEMTMRKQKLEDWMSSHDLPEDIRDHIRQQELLKQQETAGLDVENLLQNLPQYLRRDVKRHLCLSLLQRVPIFGQLDEEQLTEMCDRLKRMPFTKNIYIFREGDTVGEMIFVVQGKLLSLTTNGGNSGFFNSVYLRDGDFCGEELISWALGPHTSSPNLPTSTRTVKTMTEVETFTLMADDLKFISSKFCWFSNKKLRHMFRFYSHQWRIWAACFIQASWRRYKRRKHERVHWQENVLRDALTSATENSPSLGATIYALRFADNVVRPARRIARQDRQT